ncbi:MAG: rhomboid family intramembrane serine protease [Saprospiraceae bacterium]|uniref:Rhomboid family intramembrane serine protease n=1 Tax=Candidatus Opimibacter skivensis TaxID=2982028 RepID=A0A9D7SW14_9BACT|nr:rhomboid family intramembrane serine protease [Candidatus Opimibacter skivensis]
MMPITPIVKHLLILNALFFIAIHLLPEHIAEMMPFYSPATGQFQPFQIITYMFTHFEVSHIFFNMLSLYFMGPAVEMTLGPKRFLGLYMISGLVALAAHCLVFYLPYLMGSTDMAPVFSVLGASGAVFGVVIAFATLYPDRELMLFSSIPIKAWVMALILIGDRFVSGLNWGPEEMWLILHTLEGLWQVYTGWALEEWGRFLK